MMLSNVDEWSDKRRGSPRAATPAAQQPVRVDLHCHSSASETARRGVQRALTAPECATPPEEVYGLAKARGMDFVTITDHDTIAGVLALADQPNVFISEELTAWFKGEPQAVHVLCFGITPDDHDWLQAHNLDLVACGEYLHDREIACALAHPFVHVAAPLSPAHRRSLAQLFPVWETRNGLRTRELNAPAAIYIETHGGIAIGGSDDHAGVDIGRTYTEAPYASAPSELLAHIRAGRVAACGDHGSAAKWAHGSLIIAARTLADCGSAPRQAPDARTALKLAERIMLGAGDRRGNAGAALSAEDGRHLLRAWLRELEPEFDTGRLLASMQARGFSHLDLARRARRVHDRKLTAAADELLASERAFEPPDAVAARLFSACLPALAYVPGAAMLAREQARIAPVEDEAVRVAVVADGIGAMPGVAEITAQLRERGVAGHEIDVIGTDASVDRRLPAVTELELEFYRSANLGVPSLFAVAEALTERRYDVVHVCTPGPTGVAALLIARMIGLPVVASCHGDLLPCARVNSPEPAAAQTTAAVLSWFYGLCPLVLSPSRAADQSLASLGVADGRILRWEPGVDLERFNPARYAPEALPLGRFNVLYAGRLGREKGIDLLAEAFLVARDREPRLHLVLAGRGPEEEWLRSRLGTAATFLGWLQGDALASVYASADLFVFPSTTDLFGRVILEAQASGLPVLASDVGGHTDLIESGRSGCLVPPEPEALASAIRGLARRGAIRERLATGGVLAVAQRTWEHSLQQLAAGWARSDAAPSGSATPPEVARAA